MKRKLFEPIVPAEHLNHIFKNTLHYRFHPARSIMEDIFLEYIDVDGGFIKRFQTSEFDQRTWELYLFKYLLDSGFTFDRTYSSPDYIAKKDNTIVCIEAVTANSSEQANKIYSEMFGKEPDFDFIREELIPTRIGNALYSKINRLKPYWEMKHVKGNPLVLAIQDFHSLLSLSFSDSAISHYLFGYKENWEKGSDGILKIYPGEKIKMHKAGKKEIPSGFFYQPNAEKISAVIFSNAGTIPKFNRMGFCSGYYDDKIVMVRVGDCYNPDPNATKPLPFIYIVGDHRFNEWWGQGISIFHNPRAEIPLPKELFPMVNHTYLNSEGILCADAVAYSPYSSFTAINVVEDGVDRNAYALTMLKQIMSKFGADKNKPYSRRS